MELFKGNTFNAVFSISDKETNKQYTFKIGDLVRVGIKYSVFDEDYIIYKEFKIENECTSINIEFTHEEMEYLPLNSAEAIFEVELVYNHGQKIKTVYQEKVILKGVVINE